MGGGGGKLVISNFFWKKVQMSGYQISYQHIGENEGILSMSIKLPFKVKNNQGQLHLFSKFSGPSWCECLVKLCLRTRAHESREENPMRFFPTETI